MNTTTDNTACGARPDALVYGQAFISPGGVAHRCLLPAGHRFHHEAHGRDGVVTPFLRVR
jgi:hypothetical protein